MVSVPDKETLKRFRDDQAQVLRARVNVLILLALLLVPSFGVIDYYLFPEHFTSFMLYRLMASACCAVFLAINLKYNLGHHSYLMGVGTCYASAAAIIMMVGRSGRLRHLLLRRAEPGLHSLIGVSAGGHGSGSAAFSGGVLCLSDRGVRLPAGPRSGSIRRQQHVHDSHHSNFRGERPHRPPPAPEGVFGPHRVAGTAGAAKALFSGA